MRFIIFAAMAGLASLTISSLPADSQTVDPHEVYEQQCGRCHASHAASFVYSNLAKSGENVIGKRSRKDLSVVLPRHRGTNLTASDIRVLNELFSGILSRGSLYQTKCVICHDRAKKLARTQLIERNGTLIGRYTDKDIENFLVNHGRLASSEIDVILEMLKYQLTTKTPD